MYPQDSHLEMGLVLWTVVALYHSVYSADGDPVRYSSWHRNVITEVDDGSFDTTFDASSQSAIIK